MSGNHITDSLFSTVSSRRSFLRNSALSLAAVGSVAACSRRDAGTPPPSATAVAAPPAAQPVSAVEKAAEMDAMHEAGVKSFPQPSEGKGNQILEPRMENGVKVFELTAEKIQWETKPGTRVEAWAYN